MKKILSTTLALLLVLTTVCSVSLSAQAATATDRVYELHYGDKLTVTFQPGEDHRLMFATMTATETKFYEFRMTNCVDGGILIADNPGYKNSYEQDKESGTAVLGAYMEKGKTYYLAFMSCPVKDTDCVITVTDHTHSYKYYLKKATTKANGYEATGCIACGYLKAGTKETVLYAAKSMTLSATSYTYDGKVKKPTVTVKDSKGKKISASNYDISYSGGRKNVGQYTVTVKFKNRYSGSMRKTFTIKPKGTSVSKVKAAKKGFKVTWKKQATQTTGYEVQYGTASNFKKGNKTVTVSKNKTTSKSVSKLSAKKKYYVRVRTYKTVKVNGKNVKLYSGWSKAKSVTTKK